MPAPAASAPARVNQIGAVTLAIALACALTSSVMAAPTYEGTVVRVVDGDSLVVTVPAWAATPFGTVSVRVAGIDTPETRKPPAKCKAEVEAGKAASTVARGFVRAGDPVALTYRGRDKFFRLDAAVALPDGRDWAGVMLGAGLARPYAGGTKSKWCPDRKRPAAEGL